jgi:hypothetical protein
VTQEGGWRWEEAAGGAGSRRWSAQGGSVAQGGATSLEQVAVLGGGAAR